MVLMLEVPEIADIIDEMQERFWLNTAATTRSFRDTIKKRRELAHSINPGWKLTGPLSQLPQFQSDLPRKKWFELRSRVCENHFVVRAEPLVNRATLRTRANEFESVMNTGLALVEERNGFKLQEGLADGQTVDGLAILHWRKAHEIYPAFPEAIEMDVAPPMEDRDRFRRRRQEDGSYRWVEVAESVSERRSVQQAKAGFPWHVELPDPMQTMWLADTFSDHAVVAVVQEIPVLRYLRAREEEGIPLSVVESDGKLRLYRERGVIPEWWTPGRSERSVVATLWDRERFYEVASISATGGLLRGMTWELVKTGKHPYGEPPFSICPGHLVGNRPSELRYLPALEGVFKLKDLFDRGITLMMGLQEQAAIRKWWIEQQGDTGVLDEETGEKVDVSSDSAAADVLPAGSVLRSTDHEVTPGFVDSMQFLKAEYNEAAPATGRAQYQATTQPWLFRLAAEQENVEPRLYIQHQADSLNHMVRSMAKVMSMPAEEDGSGGFGEPVAVMTGGTGKNKVVRSVAPEDILSLDVAVDISPTSAQEVIATVEHGRALLNDPMVPVSAIDFLEDYMHEPDPDERYAQYQAWTMFEQNILPMIMKQEAGKKLSKEFVLGPNGDIIGQGGQVVDPAQVLAANGITPPQGGPFPTMSPATLGETPPPMPGPGGPMQPPNLVVGPNAPMMPPSAPLEVPGMVPVG